MRTTRLGRVVRALWPPVVFGILIQRTGRYELPLTISAVLLLVGALCSLAIDPTARVEDVQVVDSGIQV